MSTERPAWLWDATDEQIAEVDNTPCQCSRCGAHGTWATFAMQEGDEWECPTCWERLEALEGK